MHWNVANDGFEWICSTYPNVRCWTNEREQIPGDIIGTGALTLVLPGHNYAFLLATNRLALQHQVLLHAQDLCFVPLVAQADMLSVLAWPSCCGRWMVLRLRRVCNRRAPAATSCCSCCSSLWSIWAEFPNNRGAAWESNGCNRSHSTAKLLFSKGWIHDQRVSWIVVILGIISYTITWLALVQQSQSWELALLLQSCRSLCGHR